MSRALLACDVLAAAGLVALASACTKVSEMTPAPLTVPTVQPTVPPTPLPPREDAALLPSGATLSTGTVGETPEGIIDWTDFEWTSLIGILPGFASLSEEEPDDATGALALDELRWHRFRVSSAGDAVRCSYDPANPSAPTNSVFIISAGNEISFSFSNLGINLAPPATTLRQSLRCTVDAVLTIPRGTYIAETTQTMLGGVIKDQGTYGSMSASLFLLQNRNPANRVQIAFDGAPREEALLEARGTRRMTKLAREVMCAATRKMPLKASFRYEIVAGGMRSTEAQTYLTQVDNGDLSLKVRKALRRCP